MTRLILDAEAAVGIQLIGDEDATVVKASAWIGDDYYESVGSARRDPRDIPNASIGLNLAVGRAIRQLGRDILSDGQERVREADEFSKRQAEAGAEARKRKDERAKALKKQLKSK
jgi:hypothetical protein